ncbi:hypothetical protein [Bacillus sp. AFS055030]|uniref:hypothetical protein n=1 Tax=Bacillus sp. AFS055030 TaxID=2033507 RepID=UPI000BFD7DCC|nr:hypothetical protein [Bacillus sp. AFS055030]PGL73452.1 hypothetical protein CN925_00180 [Bacillus sp. AFS055030]
MYENWLDTLSSNDLFLTFLSILIGAIGGYANILLANEGYIRSYRFKDSDGRERYSLGSKREIILGAMAGCISYLIAVLTTNDQTPVSVIIYAFICGVSGGAYLEKLVDKNVNNKIIDFSSTLEEMEKAKTEIKKTSAPEMNNGNMHQTDTGVVDGIEQNNEDDSTKDSTNEEVDLHYNILMKRLKCARSTKEAEKYFNELVRLINNR